jgi:hypothetical protein
VDDVFPELVSSGSEIHIFGFHSLT